MPNLARIQNARAAPSISSSPAASNTKVIQFFFCANRRRALAFAKIACGRLNEEEEGEKRRKSGGFLCDVRTRKRSRHARSCQLDLALAAYPHQRQKFKQHRSLKARGASARVRVGEDGEEGRSAQEGTSTSATPRSPICEHLQCSGKFRQPMAYACRERPSGTEGSKGSLTRREDGRRLRGGASETA